MNFDNSVKIALIVSAVFHGFLFFSFPAISAFFPKIPDKQLEVTYYKIKESYSPLPAKRPATAKTKNEPGQKPAKITSPQKSPASAGSRDRDKLQQIKAKKAASKASQPKKEIP